MLDTIAPRSPLSCPFRFPTTDLQATNTDIPFSFFFPRYEYDFASFSVHLARSELSRGHFFFQLSTSSVAVAEDDTTYHLALLAQPSPEFHQFLSETDHHPASRLGRTNYIALLNDY